MLIGVPVTNSEVQDDDYLQFFNLAFIGTGAGLYRCAGDF